MTAEKRLTEAACKAAKKRNELYYCSIPRQADIPKVLFSAFAR